MSDTFGYYKKVKTRKPHLCIFCNRVIPKGLYAWNSHGCFRGEWQHWYACEICNSLIDEFHIEEWIGGEEFEDWVYEQDWAECPNCKNRYSIKLYFSENEETLELFCDECETSWSRYIGFKLEEKDGK